MSVMLETSVGDIVIDLFWEKCRQACINFIKLCKIKYYNGATFVELIKYRLGKVSVPGKKPTTIFEYNINANVRITQGEQNKFFRDEIQQDFKIKRKGLIGTANLGPHLNTSDVDYLDLT